MEDLMNDMPRMLRPPASPPEKSPLSITPLAHGKHVAADLTTREDCDELMAHIRIIRRGLRGGKKWFNFEG